MFALNLLTPMFADDYNYSFMWDKSKRIETIVDILHSQYMHYMEWGGRTVAHSIGQFLLMSNEYIQAFLNALVFILLIYLIYWHSQGERLNFRSNHFILLLITLFCWTSLPNFGETNIWLIGSVNYLWTTVIILAFLLPYRLKLFSTFTLKENNFNRFRIFLLGIIAGWTNENTALSVIVLISIFIIYSYKEKCIESWMIFGFIGLIIGYAILIFAPGNIERSSLIKRPEDYSFILYHVKVPLVVTIEIMKFQALVWIMLVVFLAIILNYCYMKQYNIKKFYNNNFRQLNFAITLIGVSILNNLIMFAPPSFPLRAGFGSSVFLIIGVLSMFNIKVIKKINWEKKKTIQYSIIIFLVITMGMVLEKYMQLSKEHSARLELINASKEKGVYSIILSPYTIDYSNPKESYYGHIFLSDIGKNQEIWPNNIFAQYYGLKSVKIEK